MYRKISFTYPLKVGTLPSGRKAIMDNDGYPICYAHPDSPEVEFGHDESVSIALGRRVNPDSGFIAIASALAQHLAEPLGFRVDVSTGNTYRVEPLA